MSTLYRHGTVIIQTYFNKTLNKSKSMYKFQYNNKQSSNNG